jgi:plasmid stability protein
MYGEIPPITKIEPDLLAALKARAERKNRSVEKEVLDTPYQICRSANVHTED